MEDSRLAPSESPDLFAFGDYRKFMLAYAVERRRSNPRWTYGLWARQLGLSGTASLTMIIKGQRNPGAEIVGKLSDFFAFSTDRRDYFHDLVRLEKAKKRPKLAEQIQKGLSPRSLPTPWRVLDERTFAQTSTWICTAIREMLRLKAFVPQAGWIAARLRYGVKVCEVQEALDSLIACGLLTFDESGALKSADGRVRTTEDVASKVVRDFHKTMLMNAALALDSTSVEEREMCGSTFTIAKKDVPEAKQLIRDFRSRLARLIEREGGDETYHLGMQFFPLTK